MTQRAAALVRETIVEPPELEQLYRQHARAVLALLRRLLGPETDAADLLQDVFFIAWRRRRSLGADKASSFLYGTAIRLASNARRMARLRRRLQLAFALSEADWNDPQRLAEQKEASRIVYSILDTLSEKRRTVFILHQLAGMTCPEIATHLGCGEQAVFSRLFQARREFVAKVEALAKSHPELLCLARRSAP